MPSIRFMPLTATPTAFLAGRGTSADMTLAAAAATSIAAAMMAGATAAI